MIIRCKYDELMPIKELKKRINPENNNKHDKDQIEQLAKILEYQGIRKPIYLNKETGLIQAGHGRLASAIKNKYEKFPVEFQEYEDDDQAYADLTADNAIANQANLDLSMVNEKLADMGPDFDLDMLGIKDFSLEPSEKYDAQCDEDETPENVETICKPGDLWELGEHRLLCGDATNIQHVERLMGGQKAQTFFTDPPYGDNVGGLSPKTGKERKEALKQNKTLIKQDVKIKNDEKIDWLKDVFNLIPLFMKENSTKMVFFKWDKYENIKKYAEIFGEPSACCVWDRDRKASAFFRFQPQHEFCFHWGNQSDKKNKSSLSNVWRIKKEIENAELHPTVKPISLIEPVLNVTTDKKEIVLDLFGGSGSTLISCEKTNRKCFMMEIDPHYCDVILKRFENYSGKKPRLTD